MLALLITVIFGLGIGYFATQNITPITIQFGDYVLEGVPLFAVILGSLLVGLVMAYILYLARSVSSKVTIYGKDYADNKTRRTVANLEHRVDQLETENARLRMGQSSSLEYPNHHPHPIS
jgi:uncharacterized integral membrane protein